MDAFGLMNELAADRATAALVLAGAATTAGLASSLHCFAMCGPLACFGCSAHPGAKASPATFPAYHLARIAAYSVFGAAAGLAGAGLFRMTHSPVRWAPWAMAAVLVATALGVGERIAVLPAVAKIVRRASAKAAGLAPTWKAIATGAMTPLLPCGLLYGLFASAFASGSAASGGLLAGAFALGGVPALFAGQIQSTWMRRLPKGADVVLKRVVPLCVAALLVYRALTPEQCPLCH
jgi:hypothetical protein